MVTKTTKGGVSSGDYDVLNHQVGSAILVASNATSDEPSPLLSILSIRDRVFAMPTAVDA